jgi:hypothetical protein
VVVVVVVVVGDLNLSHFSERPLLPLEPLFLPHVFVHTLFFSP